MNGVCGDNRFEIIAKVKEHLIKATNIEMQPEELKYADNILFRLWQLGYFDSVEKISKLEEQVEDWKSDHEYNLGLMKGLNEKIEELNKANEWHYVKDELPPSGEIVLLYYGVDIMGKAIMSTGSIDCKGNWYKNVDEEPVKWQEIVLPKESE